MLALRIGFICGRCEMQAFRLGVYMLALLNLCVAFSLLCICGVACWR